MNNFEYTNDAAVVTRLSEQRDAIYDYVVERFRYHMAQDDIDSAMALADEFFEWMDPDQLDEEVTTFFDENELVKLYDEHHE